MNKRRAWLILTLTLLLPALAACNLLARGGAATPEGSGKGDELESLGGGFVWRREGGIAGFCDIVTVMAGSMAVVETCRADPPDALGNVVLSAEQADQLSGLAVRLASFDYENSDPATADAMTITIIFTGSGDERPTDADIAAIEALASDVLRALGN